MKTNRVRFWDWPTAMLVISIVYLAAARLSITGWTPGLRSVETVSLLGTVLGLALGISRFQKSAERWLVLGYSLTIVPWVLSQLIQGEVSAFGRAASLAGRLAAAGASLWRNEPITDSLFFATLMTVLFWGIGLLSGSQTSRRLNALGAVVPAMLPLIVVQYYDSLNTNRLWAVGLFFLLAMLLIGRLNFIDNRKRWQKKHIFVGDESVFDMARNLVLAALLVILLAWAAPTPAAAIPAVARAWKEINQPLKRTHARLDDLLASLQGRASSAPGELYGNTLNLGQNAQQGDKEIFKVKPSKLTAHRPYWRVRVYDTYENGQWTVSNSQDIPFYPANGAPFEIETATDPKLDFTFHWQSQPSTLLAMPDHPFWVSRAGTIQVDSLLDERYDLLSWSASTPIVNGDQYQVRATLPDPTIKEMRAAPEIYPDWIVERYLSLPDALSSDIRRLAERLSDGYDNNYDKTAAITHYLRTEMIYSLEVTPPPVGIDPIDWFLFTWKSGFCNYYASAEVLLLRAAGIPARMVVGYASEHLEPDGYYQVRTKNAHAWPEVYFSEIGWVEFEPTANMDVIHRPSGEERPNSNDRPLSRGENLARPELGDLPLLDDETLLARSGLNTPPEAANNISLLQFTWLWIIISIVFLVSMAATLWQLERRSSFSHKIPHTIKKIYVRYHLDTPHWLNLWVRWSEVSAVERAFHAINQSLAWLGKPQPQNVTAFERATLLRQCLPEALEAIDILAEAHEKTLYTPEPVNPATAMHAAWEIRRQTLRTLASRSFNRREQSL